MNLTDWLGYIESIHPSTIDLTLERIKIVIERLNLDISFPILTVGGTNGKGSTCSILESIYKEAGYKVACYTSPHFLNFNERIKIQTLAVSDEVICEAFSRIESAREDVTLTYFEYGTIAAMIIFSEAHVDVAILEVGLGGRLDSTNVIYPIVSIITNIGYDHMNLLGDTLPKIAGEKAGIIKQNTPTIISEHQEEIAEIFTSKANELNAPIIFAGDNWEIKTTLINTFSESMIVDATNHSNSTSLHFSCNLTGPYQAKNIGGVLACIDELNKHDFAISEVHIQSGMQNIKQNTGFKGRWYKLQDYPLVMCDTAHNKDGLQQIMPLVSNFKQGQVRVVLGMVDDKDLDGVLPLFPSTALYYFCKADIPRGLDAQILKEKASKFNLQGNIYSSVKDALENAIQDSSTNDLIFVGGSTFTVAEVID
jgi:dihydrofolate synthase/folylpolyglutamate synthase